MTNAEFLSKYKLLRRLTDGAVRSYTGHQLAPRRVVMVHFLDSAERAERQAMLALLERLDAFDAVKLLDLVDVDGTTAVVTVYLEGFTSLRAWLEAKARRQPAVLDGIGGVDDQHRLAVERTVDDIEQPTPGEPVVQQPGEFTQRFGRASTERADAVQADEPRGPRGEQPIAERDPFLPPSVDPPPERAEPGDFTRAFGAQSETGAETEGPRKEPSAVPNLEERREGRPDGGSVPPSKPREQSPSPSPSPAPARDASAWDAASKDAASKDAAARDAPLAPPKGLTNLIGPLVVPGAAMAPSAIDWLRAPSPDDDGPRGAASADRADVVPFPMMPVSLPSRAADVASGLGGRPASFTQVVGGAASASRVPPLAANVARAGAENAAAAREKASYVPLIVLWSVVLLVAAALVAVVVWTR